MLDNSSTPTTDALVAGIDLAIEAHLSWTQRLMRCALLRESPGEEMLNSDAHLLCQFGIWLGASGASLQEYDAPLVERLFGAHMAMHRAVKALCDNVLAGSAARERDLEAFQYNQSLMIHLLNTLRRAIVEEALQQDVLTGLPLRHGLEHSFGVRASDSSKSGRTLWLVMIDVDHFKLVNDHYGHGVGDQALRHIAHALASNLRGTDILIRYGGEEFLGMFSVAESDGVLAVAQRMIEALRAAPLRINDGTILALTATMGWAQARPGEVLGSVVDRADRALWQGKANGRDQYVLAAD